ncbi:MAG TPA: hypothetical protein VMK66_13825 [Myxococcales bacterium]|nr:hypothetical protein [Myxococcales bacterium]
MRTLMRLAAVLAAVAMSVPALACSDMMQQTTAQTGASQQPAVASSPQKTQPAKKTVKAQKKAAKTQSAKVAAK